MDELRKLIREELGQMFSSHGDEPTNKELRFLKNELSDLDPYFTHKLDALKVNGLEIYYDNETGVYKIIDSSNGEEYYNTIKPSYSKCKDCKFEEPKYVIQFVREFFNNINEIDGGKESKYAVSMDFYVWANSDEEAAAQAKKFAKEMDSKFDNQPSILSIHKRQDAHGSTPVEFSQFDEGAMAMLKRTFAGSVSDEQKAYNEKHGLPASWKGSKEGFYEKNKEGNSSPRGSNE
jgi:hypothetical protein